MIEIVHYSSLAPLAWVFARSDARERPYVLVALAFSVSWMADTLAMIMGGSWMVAQYFPILQFGLLAAAFGGWGLVILLPWLAVLQQIGMPGPDVLVTVLGSLGVLYLSSGHRLRTSMLWYCGVATMLAVPMIFARTDPALFMWFWWPYQLARIVAFGLFAKAAWKG